MNYPKLPKPIICVVMLFTLAILSCKKNNNTAQMVTADATIINEGPVAADGCGWVVRINGSDSTYSPTNLAAQYQVDSLQVHIKYQRLSQRFLCGFINLPKSEAGIPEIQINSISKK